MFASIVAGRATASLRAKPRPTAVPGKLARGLQVVQGLRALRFEAAGLERLARLSGHAMQIQADSYLVRQGHPFHDLYAVRSGRIQARITDAEGRMDVLRDFLPGEVIGLSARAVGTYGADFVAVESSTVCPIPLHLLDGLLAMDSRKMV